MKRIIIFLLTLTQAHIFAIPTPTTGFITQDNIGGAAPLSGITQRYTTRIYSDTQSYTKGGLVFTYPTGYWTYNRFSPSPTTPRLIVSVSLNSAPSPTDTYSAVIVSSSPTSATIMVYRISNGGTVTEASTAEVSITIFGIQDLS